MTTKKQHKYVKHDVMEAQAEMMHEADEEYI